MSLVISKVQCQQSAVGSAVLDASREAKDKQRREKARQQLLKLNKQKREDKIANLLRQLNQHIALQTQQESCDLEEYQVLLEEAGHESLWCSGTLWGKVPTGLGLGLGFPQG